MLYARTVNIVLSEHAWYKMQTRASAPGDVMQAVEDALADRAKLHHLEGDRYMVTAGDLRIVVKLDQGQAIVVTVLQSDDQAA